MLTKRGFICNIYLFTICLSVANITGLIQVFYISAFAKYNLAYTSVFKVDCEASNPTYNTYSPSLIPDGIHLILNEV